MTIRATRLLLLSAASFACLPLCGCGDAEAKTSRSPSSGPPITVVAVDTSASAKEIHSELGERAVQLIEGLADGTRLIVFRFDSATAEVFDGPTLRDDAEAAVMLKEAFDRQSKTDGTNLARLLDRVDKRIGAEGGAIDVHIFTDCGTELMSKEDEARAGEVTAAWASSGRVTVSFHGVKIGHREKIRDLLKIQVGID
jgi:hypothetical protein